MRRLALLTSFALVASTSAGCFVGASRAQRTTAIVINGVIGTLGGAMIAATAYDRSQPPDDSANFQIHPDFYVSGGAILGLAVLGTIVDIFIPAPRSKVTDPVARPLAAVN
jgi:hypothetical protein